MDTESCGETVHNINFIGKFVDVNRIPTIIDNKQDDNIEFYLIKNDDAQYNNYGPYYSIEPVKWRVLDVSNNSALLFADVILEDKRFNETYKGVYWDDCTVRSWPNGYGADSNYCGINYENNNFVNSVFSASERDRMFQSNVEGVNDTFYLLSEKEAERLKNIDVVSLNVPDDKIGEITQPGEDNITLGYGDKIILWTDTTTLIPKCEAYIVK